MIDPRRAADGDIAFDGRRSGQAVYRARFSAGGTMTSSPVAAGGKIYQGTEQGTLYVVAAGPEYRELAVHDVGAPLTRLVAQSVGFWYRIDPEWVAIFSPLAASAP